MTPQDFSSLPHHDAVLRSVEVLWKQKLCRFNLRAFVTCEAPATAHRLEFSGVTSLVMPHEEAWGPSSSVNSVSQTSGKFQVEMQSGDVIELVASHFTFIAL
ncbi:MAG: hypothetical protein ABI684_10025 [Nitrospirota bacterium]